jgi:hypothetical protein
MGSIGLGKPFADYCNATLAILGSFSSYKENAELGT